MDIPRVNICTLQKENIPVPTSRIRVCNNHILKIGCLAMLKQLRIQNYAIIDDINIDFSGKLNIITGETGAGKSILTGAMALVLGARADTSVLLNREKKCLVEAVFSSEDKKSVRQFLADNDLDAGEELDVRREISSNGKSRAFVNDTPVNLDQLKELGMLLVDLHQQFDTLELADSDFQLSVLDALAGHKDLVAGYQDSYRLWISARKDWMDLRDRQLQSEKESDYNKFLFDELEKAGLRENELEEAESELKLLTHAETIKTMLSKIYFEMEEGEQSVLQQLKSVGHQIQPYAGFHGGLPGLLERLQSVQIELKDIASELEGINDRIQHDPGRIEEISERMATGYRLLKKHGLHYTHELIALRDELERKLQSRIDIAETLAALEREMEAWFRQASQQAALLSKDRVAQTELLEMTVNALLSQVGMPNARLKVEVQQTEPGPSGTDQVEFLFDANKSNRFEPIRKVASGGELSRLMLCIKSLVAQSMDLPTLIFDEIDSGISGEAAKQVGIILKDLSRKRQVVCITHQPQIAGKADAHYFVYKEIRGEMIRTNIRLLSQEERVATIAQMLSGERPTAAAMQNARELVMN